MMDKLQALLVAVSQTGIGELMLPVAIWLVLQALKRVTPGLGKRMPWVVVTLALVLVVAYRWVPELFLVLAGTMLLAALVLGSHAVIRKMTETKDPPDKAA